MDIRRLGPTSSTQMDFGPIIGLAQPCVETDWGYTLWRNGVCIAGYSNVEWTRNDAESECQKHALKILAAEKVENADSDSRISDDNKA